jgi:biotin carboxyl carrier protein
MEIAVKAPTAGVVCDVAVAKDQQVDAGAILVVIAK